MSEYAIWLGMRWRGQFRYQWCRLVVAFATGCWWLRYRCGADQAIFQLRQFLQAGSFGDAGGETNSEDGLVLILLLLLFTALCEQADFVLRWDVTLRWELVRWRNTVESCELSSELPGSSLTGTQCNSGLAWSSTYSVSCTEMTGPKTKAHIISALYYTLIVF